MKHKIDVGAKVIILLDKPTKSRLEAFSSVEGPWRIEKHCEDEGGLYYLISHPDTPNKEWADPHEIFLPTPKTLEELL